MITYKGLPGPHICDFWTREASAANYDDGSTFQIGRIDMVANTGTYLDSPFHRYADGKRSGRAAAGVAGRTCRDRRPAAVRERDSRSMRRDFEGLECAARRCWSTPAGTGIGGPTLISGDHPFLTAAAADWLAEQRRGAGRHRQLQHRRHARPGAAGAHASCSAPDIPICEHMTGLGAACPTAASASPPCRRRSPAWGPSRSAPTPCSAERAASQSGMIAPARSSMRRCSTARPSSG